MTAAPSKAAAASSRLDRRKARTRQAMIEAAIQLIAAGRGERASIQEITDAADVGFGSFYNHFTSKDELFRTASEEVLERWGTMIDTACTDLNDPAAVFATSLRLSGRLTWTHPAMASFIIGAGFDLIDSPRGLAPRALRDIAAGQAAGRFTGPHPAVALSAVTGGLLALLHLHQREPDAIDNSAVDDFTEACLRLLGVRASEARRLAHTSLPSTPTWY